MTLLWFAPVFIIRVGIVGSGYGAGTRMCPVQQGNREIACPCSAGFLPLAVVALGKPAVTLTRKIRRKRGRWQSCKGSPVFWVTVFCSYWTTRRATAACLPAFLGHAVPCNFL